MKGLDSYNILVNTGIIKRVALSKEELEKFLLNGTSKDGYVILIDDVSKKLRTSQRAFSSLTGRQIPVLQNYFDAGYGIELVDFS